MDVSYFVQYFANGFTTKEIQIKLDKWSTIIECLLCFYLRNYIVGCSFFKTKCFSAIRIATPKKANIVINSQVNS